MAPVFTSLEMLQPRKEVKIALIGAPTLIRASYSRSRTKHKYIITRPSGERKEIL